MRDAQLTVGSLFSGIGGLDLGLERAGMRVLWQCESDPYCRAVLRKHWPDVPCYEDVKTLADSEVGRRRAGRARRSTGLGEGVREQAPPSVDVLCGGFPCQPVSLAGRRRGADDERWLWPEFARIIRLLRPRYALLENVPGLLVGDGMAEVLGDLAESGYDSQWDCIPAAAVGAPHIRYRVFIVAYPTERAELRGIPQPSERALASGDGEGNGALADADSVGWDGWSGIFGPIRRGELANGGWWESEPDMGRVAHGVPSRVDRLRALGNAVVPAVAEYVGRQIIQAEQESLVRHA